MLSLANNDAHATYVGDVLDTWVLQGMMASDHKFFDESFAEDIQRSFPHLLALNAIPGPRDSERDDAAEDDGDERIEDDESEESDNE